jgi:amidase
MDELLWAGADAQARALRAGHIGAPELLTAVLARLRRVQPMVNAFRVVCDDEAVAAALAAQARLDAGEDAPLLGVPIAVKDDTDLAGHATCYGTDPARREPVAADGEMVRRLRAAGAVIVGKTHVPELMIWPFTETLHHGATRNPWAPDRTPGGSSGGSAAAVAAGIVGVAHGSDGAGSIRIPSAWCGLVGLKPTRDLVPLAPLANDWHRMSHFGPLARDTASAARFLDACAEAGPSGDAPGPDAGGSYLAAAEAEVRPLRIAVSRHSPPGTLPALRQAQRATVQRTVELLRAAGHEVVELDPTVPLVATEYVLARYLRGVYDSVRAVPAGTRLEPRTRAMGRIGALVPPRLVRASLDAEARVADTVLAVFDRVDVVLQPGPSTRPSRIGAYAKAGAMRTLGAAVAKVPFLPLWNLVGNPVLAAPVGTDTDGLPVGVQLVGPPYSERTLLGLGAALERSTGWARRRPPL